jgi:ferredoxin
MIIYFTGTGNSRYVAEYMGALTGDEVISANEYIKNSRKSKFTSDKPYVFVSPTYGWRIPRVFSDFILNGTFSGSRKVYFVMTCGTDIGNAGAYLIRLCSEKNFEYEGAAQVVMPENYVALFKVPDKDEADQIIADAGKTIKGISLLVREEKPLPKVKGNLLSDIHSRVVNPIFYSLLVSAKGFRVTDKCIGCGKCRELCPLNNVKIENNRPVWENNCTHCMACICRCPVDAIEYKNASKRRNRFYNDKKPDLFRFLR